MPDLPQVPQGVQPYQVPPQLQRKKTYSDVQSKHGRSKGKRKDSDPKGKRRDSLENSPILQRRDSIPSGISKRNNKGKLGGDYDKRERYENTYTGNLKRPDAPKTRNNRKVGFLKYEEPIRKGEPRRKVPQQDNIYRPKVQHAGMDVNSKEYKYGKKSLGIYQEEFDFKNDCMSRCLRENAHQDLPGEYCRQKCRPLQEKRYGKIPKNPKFDHEQAYKDADNVKGKAWNEQ
jgi:hypothetical protein